jgi:hypothetical protein
VNAFEVKSHLREGGRQQMLGIKREFHKFFRVTRTRSTAHLPRWTYLKIFSDGFCRRRST